MAACLISYAGAATVNTKPCTGGIEAARIRVDVIRSGGGEPRSLSRIKRVEKGSRITYEPIILPPDVKNNAKVTLVVGPSEVPAGEQFALDMLEFKPAAVSAEWIAPYRLGLAVLALGPQGLDEKRVSNLVTRDEELISTLADYAEQTSQIEEIVETLTAMNEDGVWDDDEEHYRLDRGNPTEQALYAILRSLNPIASNPLSGGKRVGPVTLANKAAVGFFDNAGGIIPGGGGLSEVKLLLFPDTEFRAAFVQHSGSDLSLCAPRQLARSRNRQVYLWARKVIDRPVPLLALNSRNHLPIGARARVEIRTLRDDDWQYADRVENWRIRNVAGGEDLPAKVRTAAQGRAFELDLRGFPGGAGQYRLVGDWDWSRVLVEGDLTLTPLGDLAQAKLSDHSRGSLVAGGDAATVSLTGADFQFVERVTLRREGGLAAELAQPVQFFLPRGRAGGIQRQMEVEIDTRGLRSGAYALNLMQAGRKPEDVAFEVMPADVDIENLPLRLASSPGPQQITLRGKGIDKIRAVEVGGRAVKLDPAAPFSRTRTGVVEAPPGASKGERLDMLVSIEGVNQKRRIAGAIEMTGPRPVVKTIRASVAADIGVALAEKELPSGTYSSFAIEMEGAAQVAAAQLRCDSATQRVRPGERERLGSLFQTAPAQLFLTLDPAGLGQAGCNVSVAVESFEGALSEPAVLGRMIRIPKIEAISFTGNKLPDGTWEAVLTGEDLETIEKTGWGPESGVEVTALPSPVAGQARKHTLKTGMPWPSPAPRSPLFVWLRGEAAARKTSVRY
jgi:hypothetical protein